MKLIRSKAQQTKYDYVRGLEQENAVLRARLAKLKDALLRQRRRQSRPSKSSPTPSPTYAQATMASSSRSKSAATTNSTHATATDKTRSASCERLLYRNRKKEVSWDDGKLIDVSHQGDLRRWATHDSGCPRFLEDTENSRARKIWGPERIIPFERSDYVPPEQQDNFTFRERPSEYSIYLRKKSGLDDVFRQPHLRFICIPHDHQMSLMRRAYELAQHAVYDACRKYRPFYAKFFYKLGPTMVKFGRNELLSHFGSDEYRISGWRLTDICQSDVYNCLFDITGLRNSLAHSNIEDMKSLGYMLLAVGDLAAALHDPLRTEQARLLYDELEQESLQVYEELSWNKTLPFAPEWDLHHQYSLSRVEWTSDRLSDGIYQAVKEWEVRSCGVGELDEDYLHSRGKAAWTNEQMEFVNRTFRGEERVWFDSTGVLD